MLNMFPSKCWLDIWEDIIVMKHSKSICFRSVHERVTESTNEGGAPANEKGRTEGASWGVSGTPNVIACNDLDDAAYILFRA